MGVSIDSRRNEGSFPARYCVENAWGWVLWCGVVVLGVVWGRYTTAGSPRPSVGAIPLHGQWEWHGGLRLLPAVALGVLAVAWLPRLAATLPWRRLPLLAGAAASLWTLALAAADGWHRVAAPLTTRFVYQPLAATIDSPVDFMRTFTERAPDYPTHVKSHPPGATLTFWVLDRLGLDGGAWAAVLVLVAWGVAIGATVIAVAEIAGRDTARRAIPFLALAPAAVWAGTSTDTLFAGVTAVGITLIVVATGRSGLKAGWRAVAGGAVLALALHLSYGTVSLLLIPAVVVVVRRRFDLVAPAGAGALVVTALSVAGGFWWFDGLATTREVYWAGVASERPWPYYMLAGNPAALALACGPAAASGLARMRRSNAHRWLLPVAALGAVAVANASGLSKGEVERIWLPFVPWLVIVTGAIPPDRHRPWLAAGVGLGLALQAFLRSPW